MTVVPFVDPPVGTRGRPFAIFFFLSILGSSQEPKTGAVVEKDLASCILAAAKILDDCWSGARICCSEDELHILSPWKALRNACVPGGFMIGEVELNCRQCLSMPSTTRPQKIFHSGSLVGGTSLVEA